MKKYILLIILYLFSQTIKAQNIYYVSVMGDDSNSGTDSLSPIKTLNHAEEIATHPGDIIALKKGDIWIRDFALGIHHGGKKDYPIIWDGSYWGKGSNAIIQVTYDNKPNNHSIVNIIGCKYVIFQNIVIDGNNHDTYGIVVGGDDYFFSPGSIQNEEEEITVQNCYVKNIGSGNSYQIGILVRTYKKNMNNISIKNNYITDIASHAIAFYPQRSKYTGENAKQISNSYIGYNICRRFHRFTGNVGHGIHISNHSTNIIVEHNTVVDDFQNASCITMDFDPKEPGYYPQNIIIRYNTIKATFNAGIVTWQGSAQSALIYGNLIISGPNGRGIDLHMGYDYTGAKFDIFYNTIYSFDNAVAFYDGTKLKNTVRFKNNIIFNSSIYHCARIIVPGSCIHDHNLYYRSQPGNLALIKVGSKYINKDAIHSWESSAIVSDPLFVNIPNNFHLQDTISPAYKSGEYIQDITEDIEGAPIVDPPTLGCYQLIATAQPPTVSSATVENETPNLLDIIFDLYLDNNFVPNTNSFHVTINGNNMEISSVEIISNKVRLTLANEIKPGDKITVSYNKPASNSLRSNKGIEVASFSSKPVTNNLIDTSLPPEAPIAVVSYDSLVYSGFKGVLDASGSHDRDGNPLNFHWTFTPDTIPVSSTNQSRINMLAPMVPTPEEIDVLLEVSNGDSVTKKNFLIRVMPYHPELPMASLTILEASDSAPPHIPANILDQNINTWWAANGMNQYLIFRIEKPFKINHLELSFQPGQKRSSFFDIYGARDSTLDWQPVLTNQTSCDFSGKTQVFPLATTESLTTFSYIKLIGMGNSQDLWNTFSEIRIRGTSRVDSLTLLIYPNPATDKVNISIRAPDEMTENPDVPYWTLNILNISEQLVYQQLFPPESGEREIPLHLSSGVYVVQLITGPQSMIAQKLVIIK